MLFVKCSSPNSSEFTSSNITKNMLSFLRIIKLRYFATVTLKKLNFVSMFDFVIFLLIFPQW